MSSIAPNQKLKQRPVAQPDQIGRAMQLLSGKWKLQIIAYLLHNGSARFSALQRGIAPISPRVLSSELQDLQESHIVLRVKADHRLIAVDYELTPIGRMLEQIIESVASWGIEHKKFVAALCQD